jgi:hypothetical protein
VAEGEAGVGVLRVVPGSIADAVAEQIALMRTEAELQRRWPDHPAMREWAAGHAAQDRLFVQTGIWFHDIALDAQGGVRVYLDTGEGADVEREANALEAHLVWHRWVPQCHPALAAWVPARPLDAVTCEACAGTGRHDLFDKYPEVMCACGNAGWIPAEAVGLEAFVDWPSFDSSAAPPKPGPSTFARAGQRLRRWFGIG